MNLRVPSIQTFLALCFACATGLASAQSSSTWMIEVSIEDQRVAVYRTGALIREMVCSTGIPDTDDATPEGDYILNGSGKKRGKWFYSEKYGEGAKYWVGFIGGTYLFHSVPMDRNKKIIESEAKKLGFPASHGCVRLSVEDAKWLYETVPDGAKVHIARESLSSKTAATLPVSAVPPKESVVAWVDANMGEYRQKYTLSCEVALTRLSLAIAGIRDLSEDEILESMPKGTDPETCFVCDDINAGRTNKDGSIHWNNYGTHAPVVAKTINAYLAKHNAASAWEARELKADDAELRSLISDNPDFRGAIVWLVGHPERWGENPPVNERGMVLGEHVRFLEPTLADNGAFRIRDPETGKIIESTEAGAARKLFAFRVVGLFAKGTKATVAAGPHTAQPGSEHALSSGQEKILRGAPTGTNREGALFSLGNAIRSLISPESDAGGIFLLALLGLGYGVLHALGPGHQKTLLSGYLVSEGGGIGTAIAASGIASLSHAVSVIGLFALLMLLGSGLGLMDVTDAANLVTRISGAILVALALVMAIKRIAALVTAIRNDEDHEASCSCGHRHVPGDGHADSADEQPLSRKGAIPLLISGSLSPCPGAALFLLYGFHAGNPLAGIAAVLAISLGMWGTLITIGIASIALRSAGISKSVNRASPISRYSPAVFGVCGSCVILVVAVFMIIPG